MSSAAAIAFPSLVEAIRFLTYPLSLTVAASTAKSVQQILLSTLSTSPAWLRSGRLTLAFAALAPPHAVFTACVSTHVDWSDWFYILGGREFSLTIERNAVSVQVAGIPGRAVIWKHAPIICSTFMAPQMPRASLDKSSQFTKLNKASPTIPAYHISHLPPHLPSRTIAQQLLQSDHEKEETDEMFAMISKLDACVISPTPTRERFDIPRAPVLRAPAPSRPMCFFALEEEVCSSPFRRPGLVRSSIATSPYSSPESSRPSSPSSSLFSYSSSQESLTSISTICSTPSLSPSKIRANPIVHPNSDNLMIRCREPVAPSATLDFSKSRVQRYLYQGGQSTTLTGGVMLGAAPKASAMPSRAKGNQDSTPRSQHSHRRRLQPQFHRREYSVSRT